MARYRHKPTEVEAVPVQLIMAMAPPDRPQWVQDQVLSDGIIITSAGVQIWNDAVCGYVVGRQDDMLMLSTQQNLRVLNAAAFHRNFEVV